jgi:hypothetical protein
MHLDLSTIPAHIINGDEIKGIDGDDVVSQDPFFGKVHWQKANAKDIEIDLAVESSKKSVSFLESATL